MSRLSVVIATHDRETRLAFALDALAEQVVPVGELEVIVVRGPNPAGSLIAAPEGLDVIFLESEELGPGPQRNAGWRAATAPLVAFLDDDCRASEGWAGALIEAYEAENPGVRDELIVQGQTQPDPDEVHLLYGLARTIRIEGPTELYETCNLVYPRSLLERLGGFDEGFRLPHWGEDTDLGMRAEEAGAELRFAEAALAWHAVHSTLLPEAIREAGRRRWQARLVARHPRLRSNLVFGIFMNATHASLVLALASALGATAFPRRRRILLSLGFTPYVARAVLQLERAGAASPRGLVRLFAGLPLRASIDAAETLATVRGAVEERTPVV